MKNLFAFFILIAISTGIFAQTEVHENQSGTWTKANSPYQVIGEITVPAGEVLTIEAGVEVNFQGNYKFNVIGNLQAIGTEADSIFFTTDDTDTGWSGIRVNVTNSDDIIALSYCKIEYGKANGEGPDGQGGGLALLASNALVSNCVFAYNEAVFDKKGTGGAVYASGTGKENETLTVFDNCKFIANNCDGEGGAIKLVNDNSSKIVNCEFIENRSIHGGGGAISCYSVVDTKITNCLIANNSTEFSHGAAIHILGEENTMFIENCTIAANDALEGEAGGVYLNYGNATIVNTIFYENSSPYSTDAFLDPDSNAEINNSNIIMPDNATGEDNIEDDPLFIDSDEGDFQLDEDSPCIDTGKDIGLPFLNEAPDMGCFEYEEEE